jgi:HK97 family phage portal protein
MRLLGFEIGSAKKATIPVKKAATPSTPELSGVIDSSRGGGWLRILESFPGAWQQNLEISRDDALSHFALFSCVTIISQSISKLGLRAVEKTGKASHRIWTEVEDVWLTPLLQKPSSYLNRIKFFQYWLQSKLIHGNTYALKRRDNKGRVVELYLLDPTRVRPMVTRTGAIWYECKTDNLSGLQEQELIPASEIIHDVYAALYHPLVGISPLTSSMLSAAQGIKIQQNAARFFGNMSRPSGFLTAPGEIADATAARLKASWEELYGGDNIGRVAVLGDALTYVPMQISASDSQLIEQLKISGEVICSAYHVPPFMIGIGTFPANTTPETLYLHFYNICLQPLIEELELCLDEGLEIADDLRPGVGVEIMTEGLLRMDTGARYKSHSDGISGGWMKPNEARLKEDLDWVDGGDTPYMQQQNYPLAQLAKRPPPTEGNNTPPPNGTTTAPAPSKSTKAVDEEEELPTDLALSVAAMILEEANRE